MSTKAELEAENADLRAQLEEARAGRPTRAVPGPPSFGMCAGVAAELEVTGKTVDPFTGKVVTSAADYDNEPADEPADDEPLL